MKDQNELFEMCFELEDIIDIEESGYRNVYDITVDGNHSFILSNGIVSHNSALGGLSPVLGRKECGFYVLKGKPLNAYSSPQSKFTTNKELSELYKIIQNEITFIDMPDGDFYEIEMNDKKYIVNINDNITIDGKMYKASELVKRNIII